MFCQNKVWVDHQVCLHESETALKYHLDEHHVCSDRTRKDTLHFYENLDGQIFPSFVQINRVYRSFCHLFPTNIMEYLAPPDNGLVALINYWSGIFLD